MRDIRHFVNGSSFEGASGRFGEVFNPNTGEVQARVQLARVMAQGDLRPMAGNREAMDDLKHILAERTPFYSQADLQLETGGKPLEQAFAELRRLVEPMHRAAQGMH